MNETYEAITVTPEGSKYGSALVIAIQEFISGGGKYLDELYEAFGKLGKHLMAA